MRHYDLCSSPHANTGYHVHRHIATFWAATDGCGIACVGFGADTVGSCSNVAQYLSLAGADGKVVSSTQKYHLFFLRAAGRWSCPGLYR